MPRTSYQIIPVLGEIKTITSELAARPKYDALKAIIEPHLEGESLEHVSVLWEGEHLDMFVGGESSINGRMIRNIRATEIYRNNWLTQHPGTDPKSLPAISGPAVLFGRRVWF